MGKFRPKTAADRLHFARLDRLIDHAHALAAQAEALADLLRRVGSGYWDLNDFPVIPAKAGIQRQEEKPRRGSPHVA